MNLLHSLHTIRNVGIVADFVTAFVAGIVAVVVAVVVAVRKWLWISCSIVKTASNTLLVNSVFMKYTVYTWWKQFRTNANVTFNTPSLVSLYVMFNESCLLFESPNATSTLPYTEFLPLKIKWTHWILWVVWRHLCSIYTISIFVELFDVEF